MMANLPSCAWQQLNVMDSSREMRAMMMAAFPCPPLPMDGGMNSHDALAYLVDVAARRDIARENEDRHVLQIKLTNSFLDELKAAETENDIWTAMTMFTRRYMMSYSPNTHDTRFMPPDAISVPLKRQLSSWLAAQYILQGDETALGVHFEGRSASQLYSMCRDSILSDANYVTRGSQ